MTSLGSPMDPVSIIGCAAAIQQLLSCVYQVYQFGKGFHEAKKEINQLCSELLGLKAALDHIQLNLNLNHSLQQGIPEDARRVLSSSNFSTPEFQEMLMSTEAVLKELLARLDVKPINRFGASIQRLRWPLVKDDVKVYIDKLERSKSWLILATTSDNVVLCRESYMKICAIDQRLQHQEDLEIRRQAALFRASVKMWLAPYDPHDLYERSLAASQEGTGRWFYDGDLRSWLGERGPPILWLRALPGAGKTTLLSAAIRHTQLQKFSPPTDTALAYFFCSFADQQSQDTQNILGSFLAQLCEANPKLWVDIDENYHRGKGPAQQYPKKMQVHEIENYIVQCSKETTKTFLFLDALNESTESSRVLHSLLKIAQNGARLRIMVSSTEEIDCKSPLINFVAMEKVKTAADIKSYIKAYLREDERLNNLSDSLKAFIRVELQKKANGMFRFVQCQLETLALQKTVQEIKGALENVPDTLGQTYRNILAKISKNDVRMAKDTLFWLAFSLRPLTLRELCEAVIIRDHEAGISDDVRLLHPEVLLQICSSLISYDTTTHKVTLAHSSVLTYLTSQEIRTSDVCAFYLDIPTAVNAVCVRCINYLSLPAFESGYCLSQATLAQRFKDWPLLSYTTRSLFVHLSNITLVEPLVSVLLNFFATHTQPAGGNFATWVQAWYFDTHGITVTNTGIATTPLYFAARFGLLSLVKVILSVEGIKNLEVPGGLYDCTPLHVAAWQGETEVVKLLLEHGADVEERNCEGKPGLLWAVKYGYKEIEQMLKDAGANLEGVVDSDEDEDEQEYVYEGIDRREEEL